MARNGKKKKKQGGGTADWLITFSDVMTLLLTFFVLLLSMASLQNPRKEHLVLGSISKAFGMGAQSLSVLGKKASQEKQLLEPGPLQGRKDLETLQNLDWEDQQTDVEFISNAFVQILSLNAAVLFKQGETELSPEGQRLLRRIAPRLQDIDYPVLIAGHTAILPGEQEVDYLKKRRQGGLHPSWSLSLSRTLRVYRFLLDAGLSPGQLKMEAFGKFQPRYSNFTRKGRRLNRRVDLVLDKRNAMAHNPNKLKSIPDEIKGRGSSFRYKGFEFDVDRGPSGN
jgi:chemotaxis protein MotB